jgi:hypothetical protein
MSRQTFSREEATALTRIQVAMWLPAKCKVCGKPYASVDDFLERQPRAGPGFGTPWDHDTAFIDDACYTQPDAANGGDR